MNRSMARHAFGNTAAWVAATLTPFVVTALVFRRLGEGAYGVWATVLALRGVLLLLDGGLVLGVSRDAALLAELDNIVGAGSLIGLEALSAGDVVEHLGAAFLRLRGGAVEEGRR